jgi:HAD superfamily hydrolase (TIGR01490 family)
VEAAFFDLDKTIIARSSPLALGRSFFKEGLIGRSFLLKSIYAQLVFHLMGADEGKMERMREEASRLTAGWDQERVKQVVLEVLEDVISPLIYAEALQLMFDHREAGRYICIVSSSPAEIVEPFAEMMRVDHWIASQPEVVDGKFTGQLDFYAYGPHKATAMTKLAEELELDLEGSFAYSDSVTDLPMLEAVGNPVAVNPDKELRRIAVERGWTIEAFQNPVSLRSRFPQIRRPEFKRPEFSRPELRRPELSPSNKAWGAAGLVGVAAAAWWVTKRPRQPH